MKPTLSEEGQLSCNSAGQRVSACTSCLPFHRCCCAELFTPQHLPQEANVLHLPSGLEGFPPSRRAQPFPPCTLGIPCRYTETQHGVSILSEQRAHKTLVWERTHTEFKLLCRGYDLKNCCLGKQTTLLCLVLKGHTVLISDLVFSPPALL